MKLNIYLAFQLESKSNQNNTMCFYFEISYKQAIKQLQWLYVIYERAINGFMYFEILSLDHALLTIKVLSTNNSSYFIDYFN